MKKNSFKFLAAVISLTIIISCMVPAFVYAVNGYDDIPEMLHSEGMISIYEGMRYNGVLGADACDEYYLPGYGGSDNISVANPAFNSYDDFELDFYIDNAANFAARVSKLYFVVKRDNNSVKYEFQDQITKDGWNHVKLPITWTTGTDKWVLEGGYVRFYITKNASDTGAADRYRLGNICAIKESYIAVPKMPESDGMLVIYDGARYSGTLGAEALDENYLPGYGSSDNISISNPAFNTYDNFELDFYTDNAANFSARVSKLYFVVRRDNNAVKYEFQDQITKDGWNHVKIPTSWTTGTDKWVLEGGYVRFYITKNASDIGATDNYILANICATKESYNIIPEMVKSEGMLSIYEGMRYSGALGAEASDENYLPGYTGSDNISVANPEFNTYDNFELDFYIDNAANFAARISKLYFVVKRDNNSVKYEFQNQVAEDGWNHVKIPISWETGTDKWVLEGGYVRFYITKSASDTGATDRYILANICATKDVYNAIPEIPKSEGMLVIYEGARYSGALGADASDENYLPGYTGSDNISVANPAFDTYDDFELDFYVDNADNFSARVSNLYFVVKRDNNSVKYDFKDQITEDGWNHVKIPITWTTGTDKWVLEGGYVRFYITKNASDTGAYDRYVLANICATKDVYNAVPEKVVAAREFEIYNGVKYEGLLGSDALDQYYLPGYSAVDIMNVSNPEFDTYDNFELDYYVDNISNFNERVSKMEFAVRSSGYGTKLFDFTDQITNSGWNHIIIPIDYSNDSEKSCLDTAHQVRIYITTSAGEKGAADRYRLANVYATAKEVTHVPGDINGDCEINNKDLTRLFQYLSGWDVEINEAALDINGDGSINNKDLIRLFQYLSNWEVIIH